MKPEILMAFKNLIAANTPDMVCVVEERVHVSDAASGYVGVYQRKGREGWFARIEHNQGCGP